MESRLTIGEAVEDWTGDARYFEYSRAANPVGSGHIPAVPLERFAAADHASLRTGVVAFDNSAALGITHGPATSPALLASFVRIAAGDEVVLDPVGHVDAAPRARRGRDDDLRRRHHRVGRG